MCLCGALRACVCVCSATKCMKGNRERKNKTIWRFELMPCTKDQMRVSYIKNVSFFPCPPMAWLIWLDSAKNAIYCTIKKLRSAMAFLFDDRFVWRTLSMTFSMCQRHRLRRQFLATKEKKIVKFYRFFTKSVTEFYFSLNKMRNTLNWLLSTRMMKWLTKMMKSMRVVFFFTVNTHGFLGSGMQKLCSPNCLLAESISTLNFTHKLFFDI